MFVDFILPNPFLILLYKSTPTRITFTALNFTLIVEMAYRCGQPIG
jgi:hypothetical protein